MQWVISDAKTMKAIKGSVFGHCTFLKLCFVDVQCQSQLSSLLNKNKMADPSIGLLNMNIHRERGIFVVLNNFPILHKYCGITMGKFFNF